MQSCWVVLHLCTVVRNLVTCIGFTVEPLVFNALWQEGPAG